jgi:hypothetical protein
MPLVTIEMSVSFFRIERSRTRPETGTIHLPHDLGESEHLGTDLQTCSLRPRHVDLKSQPILFGIQPDNSAPRCEVALFP